jgi:hypothetical protein
VVHTPRGTNEVAHRLPKLALAIGKKHIWVEDYPPCIHECVLAEQVLGQLSNKKFRSVLKIKNKKINLITWLNLFSKHDGSLFVHLRQYQFQLYWSKKKKKVIRKIIKWRLTNSSKIELMNAGILPI